MSESKKNLNPRNWHGADFETLSGYIREMKSAIDDFSELETIADALKAPDCPLSVNEKCAIMDLIITQSLKREANARNPQSVSYVFYAFRDRENPIPKWCEAQKKIIESIQGIKHENNPRNAKTTTPDFTHLILFDKPDILINALRKFIEADGRKAAEIGAMFLRCRILKYISGNPSEAEAKSIFKISVKWSGVQNYMPKDVKSSNYDVAFNLADRLQLFDGEPIELPY